MITQAELEAFEYSAEILLQGMHESGTYVCPIDMAIDVATEAREQLVWCQCAGCTTKALRTAYAALEEFYRHYTEKGT